MTRILAILALCLAVTGQANAGENSALRKLITGNDGRGWEAVGRLEFGGRSFCTGTLISPDLVLTAGHCLFDKATGKPFRAGEIRFQAGLRNGRASAYRGAAAVVTHPQFEYDGGDRISRVALDLGLIRLDQPIRNGSVTPLAIAPRPRKGAQVGVVSYGRGRVDSPALQEACFVLARRSGTLLLSCEVDYGSSGAPVFTVGDDGRAQIVSVVSAKAEVRGDPVALGTSLQEPLQIMKSLLETGDAVPGPAERSGPRVLTMDGGGDAGAKFLRP